MVPGRETGASHDWPVRVSRVTPASPESCATFGLHFIATRPNMQPGGCLMPETDAVPADRIEKKILLRAPRKRVWRALTDPVELGQWFGAKLPPGTFAPGRTVRGSLTYPGYEHVTLEITIEKMEPERLFSW